MSALKNRRISVSPRVQVIDKSNILKEIDRMRVIEKHYTRLSDIAT
jgi:hypothetical protein